MRIICGAPPARLPLGAPCMHCRGRRVVIDVGRIVACPICCTPHAPMAHGFRYEPQLVDLIARAA